MLIPQSRTTKARLHRHGVYRDAAVRASNDVWSSGRRVVASIRKDFEDVGIAPGATVLIHPRLTGHLVGKVSTVEPNAEFPENTTLVVKLNPTGRCVLYPATVVVKVIKKAPAYKPPKEFITTLNPVPKPVMKKMCQEAKLHSATFYGRKV